MVLNRHSRSLWWWHYVVVVESHSMVDDDLESVMNERALQCLEALSATQRETLERVLPNAPPLAISLIRSLLTFNANRRLTAELDRSRAAQAAAQSAAQTTERVLREENAQLKADRDAALAKAAQSALEARSAVEASAASRPAAAPAAAPAVGAASSLQPSDFSGRFLVASEEKAPEGGHSPEYLRMLLRR